MKFPVEESTDCLESTLYSSIVDKKEMSKGSRFFCIRYKRKINFSKKLWKDIFHSRKVVLDKLYRTKSLFRLLPVRITPNLTVEFLK